MSSKYKEGRDSTFTNFGIEYWVDDLIELAKDKPQTVIKVSELEWVFDYTKPDPKRVKKASLEYPIIVTEDVVDGKMRYIVLDGLHRLAKTKQEGRTYALCRVVTKKELESLPKVKK